MRKGIESRSKPQNIYNIVSLAGVELELSLHELCLFVELVS
jgi:hypothetical protein